jgi:glutamyl-tRNA synthetase
VSSSPSSLSTSSPIDEEIRKTIKIIALKNAIQHDGSTRNETVISKTIASRPDLRNYLEILMSEIRSIVDNTNSLSLAEQKLQLESLAPGESSSSKKKVRHDDRPILPPLEDAKVGSVITRFPPEPNGYPHIGHAKAAFIDEEYARMYEGKLILRFDDTNPLNEKLEYYGVIREGLEWLGIRPDIVKNTSDDIQLICNYGKKLVLLDGAYVCTCSQAIIRDLRAKGVACDCRKDPRTTADRLDKFFNGSFEPNTAVVRFKGDMADRNTAMRDPTLFRIIDGSHPKLGSSNRVWPTYDFAVPIEDSLDGVTHALRSKEYELRNALYFAILERLSLRKPSMLEFSRLEFEGMPVSKRNIKPLIEAGLVQGWDDPRLPTLAGLKRRGFLPQAIRKFVLSLGITLSEAKPPFEALESFNRKLIDPQCIRLFFVRNPVQLQVRNGPLQEVDLMNHPNSDLGHRKIHVSNTFYINGEDAARAIVGDEIRLMELYNVRITEIKLNRTIEVSTPDSRSPTNTGSRIGSSGGSSSSSSSSGTGSNSDRSIPITNKVNHGNIIIAEQTGDNKIKESVPKIQWVSKDDMVEYKVVIPRELYSGKKYNPNSLEICEGLSESFVSNLKVDSMIQFVRFGFCRINGNRTAIFTHR